MQQQQFACIYKKTIILAMNWLLGHPTFEAEMIEQPKVSKTKRWLKHGGKQERMMDENRDLIGGQKNRGSIKMTFG